MDEQLSDAEKRAYDAAKAVMEDAGMVFPAPWDGDLSDLEREQFDTLLAACRTFSNTLRAQLSAPEASAVAIPYNQTRLHSAAVALQNDLLARAEFEGGHPIVNASHSRWVELCEAIEETDENHSAAIHNAEQSTPTNTGGGT